MNTRPSNLFVGTPTKFSFDASYVLSVFHKLAELAAGVSERGRDAKLEKHTQW